MKTCNNCGTKQIDNRKTCVECNQKFGEKSINILEQKEKNIQSTKFDKIIGIINILIIIFYSLSIFFSFGTKEIPDILISFLIINIFTIINCFVPSIIWHISIFWYVQYTDNTYPSDIYLFLRKFSIVIYTLLTLYISLTSII